MPGKKSTPGNDRGVIYKRDQAKDNPPVVKKRQYPKLAESRVSDGWGFDLNLELKDRRPDMEPCINLISSGGRWFLFIPVGLWPDVKREVDKMIKGAKL